MVITLIINGIKCRYKIRIINMSLLKQELDALLTTSYVDADGNKVISKLAQIITSLLDLYTDYLQGTGEKDKNSIQAEFTERYIELMSYSPNMDESFQTDLDVKIDEDKDTRVNIIESHNTITSLFTMEKLSPTEVTRMV